MKNAFLLILVLLSFPLFAQKHEVGIQTAYGKGEIEDSFYKIISPLNNEFSNYTRFGFVYYYRPKKSVISFNTAINYDALWEEENHFHFIRIPLGIDFLIGNKYQIIFGGGFYGSLLLAYHIEKYYPDFKTETYNLQFGFYYNFGLAYQINKTYNISLKYQYIKDLSVFYIEPHGSYREFDRKNYGGFLQLCLRYKLPYPKQEQLTPDNKK